MQFTISDTRFQTEAFSMHPKDFFRSHHCGGRSLVKVLFFLPAGWHGHASETLWAEWLGGNRVRLLNTPFFAKGISRNDIISVRRDDGWLTLDAVIERSGHSTVRLLLDPHIPTAEYQRAWQPVQKWGCNCESVLEGRYRLIAVDIPPRADFDAVHDALERGERAGVWQYDEAHCGHGVVV